MKCPQCGEETPPGKTCGRCGTALPPQKDVEVEYREFRVSEVLDIRMVKNGGGTSAGEDALSKEGSAEDASPAEAKLGGRKSRIFIIAAIVIALVIIGGLYLAGFFEGF